MGHDGRAWAGSRRSRRTWQSTLLVAMLAALAACGPTATLASPSSQGLSRPSAAPASGAAAGPEIVAAAASPGGSGTRSGGQSLAGPAAIAKGWPGHGFDPANPA